MFSSLTIVMAAYNEEESIARCVARTLQFLRENIQSGELIVVNDGSSDTTGQVIDALAKENREMRTFHLEQNSGMGAALLKGYEHAAKEWVTMLPGDGQIDAYQLPVLLAASQNADVVTSLYKNRTYTLKRKILSKGLRILTDLIVGAHVPMEGTYLIRSDLLKKLRPKSHSFLLNLEIPIRAKRAGCRLATVHINVSDRIAGVAKAPGFKKIQQTFWELFKLRISMMRERSESP